ncbi:protein SSUH2 homolog isoform X2 [Amphiura filiformis]|uniref:protein SSUH2 homolog isoform X2 n=1 Tax=Amphiura filiformis TaxID=82378 RepID=UPI003B219105
MQMNTNEDYPPVGVHPYPGGSSQPDLVPIPLNQPDIVPPPCRPYTALSQTQTGCEGSIVAAEGVQVQIVSQPSVPRAEQEALDIPPPAFEPTTSENSRPRESFLIPDLLSEKLVREALLKFVDQNSCYDRSAAKHMNIDSLEHSSALHYQLETFSEARYTRSSHCAYLGGDIDGPQCGRAPLLWQIDCQPTELFSDHQKELEVPHTSVVKKCFKCSGSSKVRCGRCSGKCEVICGECIGQGDRQVAASTGRYSFYTTRSCLTCAGSGKVTCTGCSGRGHVQCRICKGTSSLRHFIKMFVRFTNHQSEYIMEGSDMPAELIRDARGQVIFEQSLPHVWPISQYTVEEINDNSKRIVGEHRQAWPKERMLVQRQVLRSVPVSEVAYTWKNMNGHFWVCGFEHKVYAPDYPHQACWGCNVL